MRMGMMKARRGKIFVRKVKIFFTVYIEILVFLLFVLMSSGIIDSIASF